MKTLKFSALFLLMLLCTSVANAQDKELFNRYNKDLNSLYDKVFNAPTDNERYNANEVVLQTFQEALTRENSFFWKWDFGTRVSVLTSPDKKFKIVTWPVVRDNGEYECFGFVQAFNERSAEYEMWILNDKSDEIISAEEMVLDPENWFGAVYQELIVTKHEDKLYYTLLGWSGRDNLTQCKVIEPIMFRSNGSKPSFGQNVFRKEKNLRRMLLQYSRNAMVNLRYETQIYTTTENKKVKNKSGRIVNVPETKEHKEKMIIFDELAPMTPGMEGLFQYYVPTGVECAYIFVNGKWEMRNTAQGRVENERLNKEFAPLPKSTPRYNVELKVKEDKNSKAEKEY